MFQWIVLEEVAGKVTVAPFVQLIKLLEVTLTWILRLGRTIGCVAIGLMVMVILVQVFFRYVLNNALPWPDEAARFLMLWMTALIAPSAYRWGGFVAIATVPELLGRRAGLILNLILLSIALAVLVVAVQLGQKHVASGWLFNSSTLKLPLSTFGGISVPIKLAWMYMSLPIGFALMCAVNVELILKSLHMLFDPNADYTVAPDQISMSAE
ncbi:MAG: TRAP transporter small permease [Hyphomicrobiaceae bacterium]